MGKKKVVKEYNIIKHKFYMWPVVFILGINPLIMRYIVMDSNTSQFVWNSINDKTGDMYTYYKSIFFLFIVIITLIIVGFVQYKTREIIRLNKILIPLIMYNVITILSTIASKYKYFSIFGMVNHFENVFVIIGYSAILYYCYIMINDENDLYYIIKCLKIFVIVMVIIGFSQMLGHDVLMSGIGKNIVLPEAYRNADIINHFEKNRTTLTLYNPNYVASYVSIMLPFFFVLTIFKIKNVHIERNSYNKNLSNWIINRNDLIDLVIYIIIIIGLLLALFGSKSMSGIVALIVSIIFGLVCFISLIKKNIKIFFGVFLTIIFVFLGLNFLNNKVFSISNELKIQSSKPSLEDIQTNKDNVIIDYKGNTLSFSYEYKNDNMQIYFYDEDGNSITEKYDKTLGIIDDNRYKELTFVPTLYQNGINEDAASVGVIIDGVTWYFTNQLYDGSYYYYNVVSRPDKIKKANSAVFTGYETIGSGRGYIWSRTIPLLKNNLLLGSGPDTYSLVFPQNDYVNIHNYATDQLIDKAHNMYLQIGVQTGVLSMLVIIIFFILYIIQSLKVYLNCNYDTYLSQVGLAAFLASVGFMSVSLFNDSNICVSPVFWTMLGIGMAINNLIKHKTNDNKQKI